MRPSRAVEPEARESADPTGAAQYVMAAFVGLLLAVAIGGSGFYVWSTRTTQSSAFMSAAPPPMATAPAASAASTPALQAASAEIVFRTTPADAVIVVDGSELPPDRRLVARPAAGRTVTVVMRAKGHDDSSVQVDYFTKSPLVVELEPIIEVDSPGGVAGVTAGSAPPSPAKPRSASKPRSSPTVLPDNPY
jgi:hypothetical protein